MKFKGTIVGELSGSLASLTASHNRGGQYLRQRVVPTDPATPFQTAIRGFVAMLTTYWVDTLTPLQRADWDVYALNVLIPDTLGEPRNIGGLGQFIRSNVPRLQAGLDQVDDAPTIFDLGGEFTAPVLTATAATSLSLAYTNTDSWANEDGGAMLFYASRPQNPSVNFFKGPYRFIGDIEGDAMTPPTSPFSGTSPFTLTAGQRVFANVRVSRADGRLSHLLRFLDTVA